MKAATQPTTLPPARAGYVTANELCAELHVTRRTIERWCHARRFPRPVRFSARAVRWKRSEVDAYLQSLDERN